MAGAVSLASVEDAQARDRKSVVEGKRGELGGRRIIKKKKKRKGEVAVEEGAASGVGAVSFVLGRAGGRCWNSAWSVGCAGADWSCVRLACRWGLSAGH